MAIEKQVKGVIIPRHDTAINWSKAVNFIPKKGELIVFDADTTTYSGSGVDSKGNLFAYESSDRVRIKFGDGTTNVNLLDFIKTGGGTFDGDLTGIATEDWVQQYVNENTGAIVYTEHETAIGHRIELPDVYPIQTNAELKVISRNMFKPNDKIVAEAPGGDLQYTISSTSPVVLGEAIVDAPGKYIVKLYDYAISSNVILELSGFERQDDQSEIKRFSNLQIPTSGEIEIDSSLLAVNVIRLTARCINSTSNLITIFPSVEYQTASAEFIPYVDTVDLSKVTVNIYERNLLSPDSIDVENITVGSTVKLLDSASVEMCSKTITTLGAQIMYGTMTQNDGHIVLTCGSYSKSFNVPLIKGDKFTFIFKCSSSSDTVDTVALMLGHIIEPVYEDYNLQTITCDDNGNCDVSKIKFPYTLLTLSEEAYAAGYSLYIKWDSALTRRWVEEQIKALDAKITQQISDTADDIIVSETEPVVTGETIWLQPITTDTGAVDYIVEQNISDTAYYEKWNSGIIKYFANSTVASTTASRTNVSVRVDIPKTLCKSIISCNANGYGAMGAGSTTYELKQVSDNTSQNVFSINGVFSSLSANETGKVYVSVVGKWK